MFWSRSIASKVGAVFSVLLFLCSSTEAQISTGLWVGSVDYNGGPPTAARFEVAADASEVTIIPHVPGLPVVPVYQLRMSVDTIAFSWSPTKSHYDCLLAAREEQHYEGACTSPAGGKLDIHISPPGSSAAALSEHALSHEEFSWMRLATDHMDLYFHKESYSYERGRTHSHHGEQARERALEILGEQDYSNRISVFYVDSAGVMQELFGDSVLGKPDPLGDAVALALNQDVALRERHELMHVLSWGLWGVAASPYEWVSEGLATYAQGRCQGHDLHDLAHSLNRSGALLPIDTLIQEFWSRETSGAYVQAGSLVRFIDEEYGTDVLRALWQRGVAELVEQTGLSLKELETSWKEHLAKVSYDRLVARWQPDRGCQF